MSSKAWLTHAGNSDDGCGACSGARKDNGGLEWLRVSLAASRVRVFVTLKVENKRSRIQTCVFKYDVLRITLWASGSCIAVGNGA